MKEKDAIVDFKEHQVVLYTEKEDQSYGPTQTGSYVAGLYLDDFRVKHKHFDESYLEQLKEGKISPVAYYMMAEKLTVNDLAKRAHISQRRVKKHLDMKHFKKATVSELEKYADVFNIPVANLFQVIFTKQDANWRLYHEDSNSNITLEQKKTNNPLIVITKKAE